MMSEYQDRMLEGGRSRKGERDASLQYWVAHQL